MLRQLQRAMQPSLTDIKVTWNGAGSSNLQKAPYRFAPLFAGGRLVVYGILDKNQPDGECTLPQDLFSLHGLLYPKTVEVVVTAKAASKAYETSIKIDTSKSAQGKLFTKLAAKTLLKYFTPLPYFLRDW